MNRNGFVLSRLHGALPQTHLSQLTCSPVLKWFSNGPLRSGRATGRKMRGNDKRGGEGPGVWVELPLIPKRVREPHTNIQHFDTQTRVLLRYCDDHTPALWTLSCLGFIVTASVTTQCDHCARRCLQHLTVTVADRNDNFTNCHCQSSSYLCWSFQITRKTALSVCAS